MHFGFQCVWNFFFKELYCKSQIHNCKKAQQAYYIFASFAVHIGICNGIRLIFTVCWAKQISTQQNLKYISIFHVGWWLLRDFKHEECFSLFMLRSFQFWRARNWEYWNKTSQIYFGKWPYNFQSVEVINFGNEQPN